MERPNSKNSIVSNNSLSRVAGKKSSPTHMTMQRHNSKNSIRSNNSLSHAGEKKLSPTYMIIQREILSKILPQTRDPHSGKFTSAANAHKVLAYPVEYIVVMEK